jgi:hypothetical protein
MAVDSGWIVAGSSLATIIATGAFNIWLKRLEVVQKLNEHKLTLRATYVNKKIDAGMDFVAKTTIRINGLYLVMVFYKYMYERKQYNKELYAAMNAAKDKQRETNLSNSSSPHIFFDLLSLNDDANKLIHEINNQQAILSAFMVSEGTTEYTTDTEIATKRALELTEQLVKIYQQMNIRVRKEVAQYDII